MSGLVTLFMQEKQNPNIIVFATVYCRNVGDAKPADIGRTLI